MADNLIKVNFIKNQQCFDDLKGIYYTDHIYCEKLIPSSIGFYAYENGKEMFGFLNSNIKSIEYKT